MTDLAQDFNVFPGDPGSSEYDPFPHDTTPPDYTAEDPPAPYCVREDVANEPR